MKLVKIKWWDHCTFVDNKWRPFDEVKSLIPYVVTTVGYVLKETKDYYILVSTLSKHGSATSEFLILKGTIKKIKEL